VKNNTNNTYLLSKVQSGPKALTQNYDLDPLVCYTKGDVRHPTLYSSMQAVPVERLLLKQLQMVGNGGAIAKNYSL
jgi:hypothetical protein